MRNSGSNRRMDLFFCAICLLLICKHILLVPIDTDLAGDLPLHLCHLNILKLFLFCFFQRQTFFDLAFFGIMAGTLNSLLMPYFFSCAFDWMAFWHYYYHFVPLGIVLYYVTFRGQRFSRNGRLKAFYFLQIFQFTFILPLNLYTGGNYYFFMKPPGVDEIHPLVHFSYIPAYICYQFAFLQLIEGWFYRFRETAVVKLHGQMDR